MCTISGIYIVVVVAVVLFLPVVVLVVMAVTVFEKTETAIVFHLE